MKDITSEVCTVIIEKMSVYQDTFMQAEYAVAVALEHSFFAPKALNIQACTEIDVQIEMDMVYRCMDVYYIQRMYGTILLE